MSECKCRQNLKSIYRDFRKSVGKRDTNNKDHNIENIVLFLTSPLIPNGLECLGIDEGNSCRHPNWHNVRPYEDWDDADRRNISLWMYCVLWNGKLNDRKGDQIGCFWEHHKHRSKNGGSYYSGDTLSVKGRYGATRKTIKKLNKAYWDDVDNFNAREVAFFRNDVEDYERVIKNKKPEKNMRYNLFKHYHCLANFFPLPRGLNIWRGVKMNWFDSTTRFLEWVEKNWSEVLNGNCNTLSDDECLDIWGKEEGLPQYAREYFASFSNFEEWKKCNFFEPFFVNQNDKGEIDFHKYNTILRDRAKLMAKELLDLGFLNK